MLWNGAAADPNADDDAWRSIRALGAKVAAEIRGDRAMVPVGDGVILARKI